MSEITTGILISLGGLTISAISLYISLQKTSKETVKDLEHRLTELESSIFTTEDRRCLTETTVKINEMWRMVMKDFPDIIHHDDTPVYDKLLKKAKVDIQSLTLNERNSLKEMLNNEYSEAVRKRDKKLAYGIAIYRAVFNFEIGDGIFARCK